LRYYELALLHSDEPLLYFNAAVALQDLGDGDGAVAYYRRCLKEDETYRDAHANLSGLLESRGDPEASKHMQRYRELGGE
jgi:tetratricopeptide (TPR) repeat protein